MTVADDLIQRTQEAIYAVLSADASLQSIMGRTTNDLVVEWEDLGSVPKPAIALLDVADRELGAIGDTRDTLWQLTAVASSKKLCRSILGRAALALTAPALLTAGLDGVVVQRTRRSGDYDVAAKEYTAHLDVTIRATL